MSQLAVHFSSSRSATALAKQQLLGLDADVIVWVVSAGRSVAQPNPMKEHVGGQPTLGPTSQSLMSQVHLAASPTAVISMLCAVLRAGAH